MYKSCSKIDCKYRDCKYHVVEDENGDHFMIVVDEDGNDRYENIKDVSRIQDMYGSTGCELFIEELFI